MTLPDTLRSPPTSRSHSGLISPSAEELAAHRLLPGDGQPQGRGGRFHRQREIERRACRPPALVAVPLIARVWSSRVALTSPLTESALPAPRARASRRLASSAAGQAAIPCPAG
jgi:hypothetical protein